jgi:hypothetical protein
MKKRGMEPSAEAFFTEGNSEGFRDQAKETKITDHGLLTTDNGSRCPLSRSLVVPGVSGASLSSFPPVKFSARLGVGGLFAGRTSAWRVVAPVKAGAAARRKSAVKKSEKIVLTCFCGF